MSTNLLIHLQAQNTREFTKSALEKIYFEHFQKNTASDFFWELQALKSQNVLAIKGGKYYLKQVFSPLLGELLKEIYQVLSQDFETDTFCFWNTSWYNQFARHQVMQNRLVIEVEKDLIESLFYYLKEAEYKEVYQFLTKEDKLVLSPYIAQSENPVILQKHISKAPTQTLTVDDSSITIPSLEKMCIDLYAEDCFLEVYQGAEQKHIFEHILQYYQIDLRKMFAYAKRRGNEEQLKQYLYENFAEEIQHITL